MSLLQDTKMWAIQCHENVNHLYDGKPYSYHLQMVERVAKEYIHLIHIEEEETILAACWAHDVIEDCRKTYNDVLNATSTDVAELVYALTNEKGKTRKERANEKYYKGILDTPWASFVKICDRIANFRHSIQTNSGMAKMYAKENYHFEKTLGCAGYKEMFDELDELCKQALTTN